MDKSDPNLSSIHAHNLKPISMSELVLKIHKRLINCIFFYILKLYKNSKNYFLKILLKTNRNNLDMNGLLTIIHKLFRSGH